MLRVEIVITGHASSRWRTAANPEAARTRQRPPCIVLSGEMGSLGRETVRCGTADHQQSTRGRSSHGDEFHRLRYGAVVLGHPG